MRPEATSCPRSPSSESPLSPCPPWVLGRLCRHELSCDCPGRCTARLGASRQPSRGSLLCPCASPGPCAQGKESRLGPSGQRRRRGWALTGSPARGVEAVGGGTDSWPSTHTASPSIQTLRLPTSPSSPPAPKSCPRAIPPQECTGTAEPVCVPARATGMGVRTQKEEIGDFGEQVSDLGRSHEPQGGQLCGRQSRSLGPRGSRSHP